MSNRRSTCAAVAIAVAVLTITARALGADGHAHVESQAAAPVATPAAAPGPATAAATAVSATDALKLLAEGNARFAAGASKRPHQDQARLCDTFANGQHPYAAVLSCADSRVPTELVFDAGIGDLFVVRVAGNVADVDEVGTIEYGVEHLGVRAILVLGHTKCGAVTAVVEHAHVTKNIERLVDNIVPAAEEARRAFPQLAGPQLVGKAIEMNVRRQMADLVASSDVIREAVKAGTVKVVGGVYDLHTGEVNWLEALPSSFAATAAPTAAPAPAHEDTAPAHNGAAHAPAASASKAEHEEPHESKDAHGAAKPNGHEEDEHHAKTDTDEHADAKPAKNENFVALGGLMGGGCVLSFGVLHFMKSRRSDTAPEADEHPETPEPATKAPEAKPAAPPSA